jgi:hypothetical protein
MLSYDGTIELATFTFHAEHNEDKFEKHEPSISHPVQFHHISLPFESIETLYPI